MNDGINFEVSLGGVVEWWSGGPPVVEWWSGGVGNVMYSLSGVVDTSSGGVVVYLCRQLRGRLDTPLSTPQPDDRSCK